MAIAITRIEKEAIATATTTQISGHPTENTTKITTMTKTATAT